MDGLRVLPGDARPTRFNKKSNITNKSSIILETNAPMEMHDNCELNEY